MDFENLHPSDQEIILAADGELSGTRADRLQKHLAACWECRVRSQELEEAVVDFVRLHRATLDPLLPPNAGGRALLKAQLDRLASSNEYSSWNWFRVVKGWPGAMGLSLSIFVTLLTLFTLSRWPPRREPGMYAGHLQVTVPRAHLTPGAARSATRQEVCTGNHDKNRAVPVALRRRVFENYGISNADSKAYEVDYLITPALGGADDIRNLWPQSYAEATWNAQVKDALEDRLHNLVCNGDLDLRTAQQEISTDWIAAYKKYFRTNHPVTTSE